jgi:hypothetical protein
MPGSPWKRSERARIRDAPSLRIPPTSSRGMKPRSSAVPGFVAPAEQTSLGRRPGLQWCSWSLPRAMHSRVSSPAGRRVAPDLSTIRPELGGGRSARERDHQADGSVSADRDRMQPVSIDDLDLAAGCRMTVIHRQFPPRSRIRRSRCVQLAPRMTLIQGPMNSAQLGSPLWPMRAAPRGRRERREAPRNTT